MKTTQLTIATTLATLLIGSLAQAQISKETYKCQLIIKKATEKFVDKVADNIEKCLLSVQKCNLKSTPGEIDTCVGKLLEEGEGRCAVGKLAGDANYYGAGSAAANNPDNGFINRELGKFVANLSKCDFLNTNFADLGLPVPGDATELADMLNGDPDNSEPFGAACVAHKRVGITFPNREMLISQLGNHADANNVPVPMENLINPFLTCK